MSKNQPTRAGNRGGNGTASAPLDGAAAVLGRAVALHMEGKLKEALGELQSGIGTHGEQPEMLAAIGHLQCELEQYEDAVKTYARLLESAPDNLVALFNQAVAFEKLGKWEAAANGFTARQRFTDTLQTLNLGVIYQNPCGFFAQLRGAWTKQDNGGYEPPRAGADYWQ